ncbi:5' exonuclease Apollo [Melanotaenia boesemani]|uniref:5' exonuclease Apollo n=1 Tax=Melanotaenia boesemani TaxID=1250792 RepID=UPI001C04316D|nr:5' exonuclease Apollo [Melanotaenia boesemani]
MSVNGKVIPHTPLAVDFWFVRKCPGTRLFFLSHMHSDHTVGLTSTWSNRPIYCSPTTATLLRLILKVKEQWIHPLELGDPYLLPLDDIGKEKLAVTLIDANHCPGAVMFLFEGYFGSIMYTGDFRYTPSMLREPCLRTNTTIDVLYLDNTYCDPNRTLPSRQRATQQIKEIIRNHPNHNVVIGLYTLGKESLLLELAMEFKTWIEVSFERLEILKALELPDVFTTERGAGRIRVVMQSEIHRSTLHQWNQEHPTLAILPTSRPVISLQSNLHVVPYSDHSSYQELEDFVSAIKPTSLVPIVGSHLPGSLSALLPRKKRHEILVPESVRHYMLSQPELSSSACTSFKRRHVRPLIPKGVIFDSPVKDPRKSCEETWEANILEQEMEIESSDNDSDCILVDPSKKLTPNKRGAGDMWNLNIVQTVSEEVVMAESMPLSQFSQSDFAPMEILRNTKACLKPVTREPFETKAKIFSNHHRGHENVHKCHTFSDEDSMSQHSETLFQGSPDGASCASSNSSTELLREHIEELENNLLRHIHFSEEDIQHRGLLPKSFVHKFTLLPFKDSDEDDV